MTAIERLYRLLDLAISRGDHAAELMLRARIQAAWRASTRGRWAA